MKGCFGFPDGCVATRSCRAITTVIVLGDKYHFELKSGFGESFSKRFYLIGLLR